jgi:hypothetical protein
MKFVGMMKVEHPEIDVVFLALAEDGSLYEGRWVGSVAVFSPQTRGPAPSHFAHLPTGGNLVRHRARLVERNHRATKFCE